MLKTIFPDKQLLIRQNGEVKYLTLPSWLQVALFLLAVGVCLVAGLSSYQNVELNKVIVQQNTLIEQKQDELDALHLSYREKHSALSNRISQINEKSELMTNMLDSLPENQQAEFKKQTENQIVKEEGATTAEQSENAAIASPEQSDAEKANDADEQSDNLTTEQKENIKLEEKEAKPDNKKEADATTNDNAKAIEKVIKEENAQLNAQFETLNKIVDKRTARLLEAIDNAGVDKRFLTQLGHKRLAQGGPFNAVNTDVLNNEQKALLDKIVLLNELSGNLALLTDHLTCQSILCFKPLWFSYRPYF